ncbi:DUF7405 family protein [Streptomyces sp. NRRL S-448]|uniref:DUF7405 family protein n=1 Tax=Streptomyces sp. NRRL S-448 TaxID=1463907 RepID=UPI00356ACD96
MTDDAQKSEDGTRPDPAPRLPAAAPRPGPRSTAGSTRRSILRGGVLAAAVAGLELLGQSSVIPSRNTALAATGEGGGGTDQAPALPDIQFDIADFIAPVTDVDGVQVQLGPVHTLFVTARLLRPPTRIDQVKLNGALAAIERAYPFSPSGVFTFLAYGLPYFHRLPGGLQGHLVSAHMPRLRAAAHRYVLEEAVPGPTDVSPTNSGIVKRTFHVPVSIEGNDLLLTLRSDHAANIQDVLRWLGGSQTLAGRPQPSPPLSDLLSFTSARAMFTQIGLPRKLADEASLPYAFMVNPRSPMWMGFADQQTAGTAAADAVTFRASGLTTAKPGSYFDAGAVQHLSHVLMDLQQFYDVNDAGVPGDDASFTERVQYMFRSTPPPSQGNADQITDGGGPAFLPNTFQGTDDALLSAQGRGTPDGERRIGHLSCLQRSSRTADGKPLHVRMDGPGYSTMDVPDGSLQPKLEFTVFVPTADFFATMRTHQASLDLAAAHGVPEEENGLERFLTATRRQNFLTPPRRHRAFPLVEFL